MRVKLDEIWKFEVMHVVAHEFPPCHHDKLAFNIHTGSKYSIKYYLNYSVTIMINSLTLFKVANERELVNKNISNNKQITIFPESCQFKLVYYLFIFIYLLFWKRNVITGSLGELI